MKSLKTIISFTIPLLTMLITFTIYIFTNNVVSDYKKKISKDYSIVIVSHNPLVKDNFDYIGNIKVKNIQTLNKENIINNIQSSLSRASLELLRQKLPYFYKIHLESFPTSSQLEYIKKELNKNSNIKSIEIFSKNHNQIYLLLILINNLTMILFLAILIFAIIVLSKQITIWFYEQQEKITIMKLHGASILYSASEILKHAIIAAFISFILISALIIFLSTNLQFIIPIELKPILVTQLILEKEIFKVFILSFGISLFTIFGVLFRYKIKNA